MKNLFLLVAIPLCIMTSASADSLSTTQYFKLRNGMSAAEVLTIGHHPDVTTQNYGCKRSNRREMETTLVYVADNNDSHTTTVILCGGVVESIVRN